MQTISRNGNVVHIFSNGKLAALNLDQIAAVESNAAYPNGGPSTTLITKFGTHYYVNTTFQNVLEIIWPSTPAPEKE
jgi:hypothetical protein